MPRYYSIGLILIFQVCFILPDPVGRAAAAEKPALSEQPGGHAIVTLLEGGVSLLDENGKPVQPVSPGHRCRPGDRIRTGNKARLSLKLQDGTVVRFSEFTTFQLASLSATETPKQRNIQIRLLSGDAWVNNAMPYTGKGTVRIFVSQAVIKTTQSICRLTAFSDHSSIVKVYRGRIEVGRVEPPTPNPKSAGSGGAKREKTAWNHLLKTMYQLHIRSDGTATNPFRFMIKTDENIWVLWNQEQDAKIGTPAD